MLTLETGTGNAGADSLVSLVTVRAYALSRGYTVSSDDATLEALVRKAHDYLCRIEESFQGERTTSTQSLPFPRSGVTLFNVELNDDAIPDTLVKAACQLVCDATTVELLPVTDGQVISKETVGPITVEYAGSSSVQPRLERAMAFLKPLFKHTTTTGVQVIRI